MPFPEDFFDLVTATYPFFFMDDQEVIQFFNEVYRVLKPYGKFYFFHPQRNWLVYLLTYLITWQRRQYELSTIKHSYTCAETKALINQSLLANGNDFTRAKWAKWAPLMAGAFGTVNKAYSK